jgi:hypothetical protein
MEQKKASNDSALILELARKETFSYHENDYHSRSVRSPVSPGFQRESATRHLPWDAEWRSKLTAGPLQLINEGK